MLDQLLNPIESEEYVDEMRVALNELWPMVTLLEVTTERFVNGFQRILTVFVVVGG